VSALEVRVKANEDAVKELRGLIKDLQDNKVDKKTYEAEVKKIYAAIEAVETNLGKALTRIEGLEKGLKDEVAAREALRKDFEAQVKIIENHTAKLAELEKTMATKAELAAEIKKVREDYAADLKKVKDDLQKAIDDLSEVVEGQGEDIEALQERADGFDKAIDQINKNLNALNVLILRSLRSIVFIPDFYYWGIEATEVKGVYVNYWNFKALPTVNADSNDPTWSDGKDMYCYDRHGYTGKRATDFIVEKFVARYHLNPSTADLSKLTKEDISILQADRVYRTKAAAVDAPNTNIVVASFDPEKDIKAGDLYLNLDILDPSKVKNIGHIEEGAAGEQRHFVQDEDETGLVTVFATEVSLKDDAKNTVTSDYAALRAEVYANGYRLSHTNVGDPAVVAPIEGAKGSYTMIVNNEMITGSCARGAQEAICAPCDLPLANRHLFTDADETVYLPYQTQQVAELIEQPRVAALGQALSTTTAQDVVVWNSTINLSKLSEVHRMGNYTAEEGGDCDLMSADEMKKNGLEIRYELTGLLMAGNKTSESAHAAIKVDENGDYILRPQLPDMKYDEQGQNVGKAAAYGATKQDRTTIGRTPLVRVLLVDTKNDNRILDYGFIRLVIIDTPVVVPTIDHRTVEYQTGINFSYTYYNCACPEPAGKKGEWTQKWGSFENDLYNMFSLPQVEFEEKYDSVLVQDLQKDIQKINANFGTVSSKGTYAQYIMEISAKGDTTFREAKEEEYVGEIVVRPGTDTGEGTLTDVLTWTITPEQMWNYTVAQYVKNGKLDKEYITDLTRVIKYQVVDPKDYVTVRDIYVILKAGPAKVTPNNDKPTAKMNWDTNKIIEYWYDENTQTTSKTLREAHLNVPSPEDWQQTWREGAEKPFQFLLSSDFAQKNPNVPNVIFDLSTEAKFKQFVTITDPTPDHTYSYKNLLGYYLEFSKENVGKYFKGFSGASYRLSLGAREGHENWALLATLGNVTDTVAYLQYKDAGIEDVNNIMIVLKKQPSLTGDEHTNSFAEDLLNYTAHNKLDNDFLKVLLSLRLQFKCGPCTPDVEGNLQVRFLRPVNMFSEDRQVQDAANTTQIIPLYDLVYFTDWREQWNPTTASTINKPRRAKDYDQVGNQWIVDYWYYYNIKDIHVGYDPVIDVKEGAQHLDQIDEGVALNSIMKTNMNGNDITKTILSSVTDAVEFKYLAPTKKETEYDEAGNIVGERESRIGEPNYYGSIKYTNNRSTVDNFKVTVPVTVCYEWGHIYTTVTIDIRKTLENTDVKRAR